MGDTMLHAVLNMPRELWREDAIDEVQRQARYMEASARIVRLEEELAEAVRKLDAATEVLTWLAAPIQHDLDGADMAVMAQEALVEIRTSNPSVLLPPASGGKEQLVVGGPND